MNSEKKPFIPKLPSPSTPPPSPITQNKFATLSPYQSPYYNKIRPTYSALINKSPTSSSSTSPSFTPKTETLPNPYKQVIKILEPFEEKLLNQSFKKLNEFLFPENTHFYTNDFQTREYYELILIETKSVDIQHNRNNINPAYIDFSKVRIKRILSIEEWGDKPYIHKSLIKSPEYPVYNYYDYIEAWNKAFLLRNYNHTWFFRFTEEFTNSSKTNLYPKWFINWFRYMGNIPEAFPPKILEGYNKYKSMFCQESAPPFEYTLQFSIIFRIPWIMSFNYRKQEANGTIPPIYHREFYCKWWSKTSEDQADIKAVIAYHNSLIKKTPSSSSLFPSKITDEEVIKKIQACSSKEEIQKIINEIKRSPSPSEEAIQDAQDPYEDDDFLT